MTSSMTPKTMRALVLSKASGAAHPSLSFSPAHPVPAPLPGHVLVRVHASAIQPSDIYNSEGGFGSTTFPRIPGRDFSGVVVSSTPGPDADQSRSWQPGTAVFGTSGATHAFTADGFHAEYALVPANGVVPKPAVLSHVQAATMGVPWTTAALTVEKSEAAKGQTVLVLGANGAVGSAACHLLQARGCRVLRGIRGPGADVDTAADPGLDTIRELPGVENGLNAVIDAVGSPALTRAAIDKALGQGGKLVFIAAPKGDKPIPELTFNMRDFYRLDKSLVGVNSIARDVSTMAALLKEVVNVMSDAQWKQVMSGSKWEEVALEDAVAAYQSQDRKRKFVIKMI
ncbi:hypothetical protein HIM_05278 [Hirsutella minnesotensis 3608]|uniref:Enoyl reductase (ER) domain-containing protein n=1 Tax=Hirsutella minnesotensis 3608 TaxID=1043627 RepID=A0A0F8A0I0_9HYPO|nr:hypothetical protein HIM_05278 [Hirsutella minnesotensis 3608]